MKKFKEIYLMPNFPKWWDTKSWVSLKTVKCEMDTKCYEKWNICTNVKNCKILEILTCLDRSEVVYQMNIMGPVSVNLLQTTRKIGSKSWLYFQKHLQIHLFNSEGTKSRFQDLEKQFLWFHEIPSFHGVG